MTNKEIESYRNSYKVVNGIGFCRVNNDINGNPRYIVHFLAFTTDEEMRNDNLSQSQLYAIAKKRANDLGFSVYRAIVLWGIDAERYKSGELSVSELGEKKLTELYYKNHTPIKRVPAKQRRGLFFKLQKKDIA